jgi:hypothetical protein
VSIFRQRLCDLLFHATYLQVVAAIEREHFRLRQHTSPDVLQCIHYHCTLQMIDIDRQRNVAWVGGVEVHRVDRVDRVDRVSSDIEPVVVEVPVAAAAARAIVDVVVVVVVVVVVMSRTMMVMMMMMVNHAVPGVVIVVVGPKSHQSPR